VQNPESVLAKAKQPVNDATFIAHASTARYRFVNLARLSVEKDHEKLIHAFHRVAIQHPDARLFILGDGPLRQTLLSLITELSLEQNVFLLGFIANPFPYLKQADCFVLSSNHEGQPMVLFEAMILGKPIVATDIIGNRDVLAERDNLLVDNSIEGLANGMLAFIDGKVRPHTIDIAAYQARALDMFYERVVGP
jgi:CDP-glycerol glycerophosphotransferase